MKNHFLLIGLLLCFPLQASLYQDVFGIGPRPIAMGGAGTASLKEPVALFYNPASLSQCPSHQLTIGVNHVQTKFNGSQNSNQPLDIKQLGNHTLGSIGTCLRLPYGFSLGGFYSVSALSPVGFALETLSSTPRMVRYGKDLDFPSIAAGASYGILPNLSVGIAAHVTVNNQITQAMHVPSLYLNLLAKLVPAMGISLGADYTPLAWLRLGLVFRTPIKNEFHIQSDTNIQALSLDLASNLKIDGNVTYAPMQLALGASFTPVQRLLVATDLVWQRWSSYEGPFLKVSPTSPLASQIQLPAPNELQFRFFDLVYPKLGIEYQAFPRISLRAGYHYRPNMLEPTLGIANLFDNATHRFATGLGYQITYLKWLPLSLDLFYTLDWMPSKTVDKPSPTPPNHFTFGGLAWNAGLALTMGF